MADYSKKTNADLVEILKSRSLPHTGKKAELVARIQQDDEQKASGAPPAATSTAAEDVIDWDDEPTETAAAQPSTEAGANAIAAGGKGAVANPVAVPNQKLDTDPAATDELKVESTGAAEEAAKEAEAKPPVDFTQGLPASELEAELAKRKKRAEKFGIQEDAETALKEAEKSLERAKRFGAGAGAEADSSASVGVKGLDEALPNESARKRRGNEQGGRGGKRRDVGRNRHGRGNGAQNRNGGGNAGAKPKPNPSGIQKSWSDKDTAAMEARKKRFAAA